MRLYAQVVSLQNQSRSEKANATYLLADDPSNLNSKTLDDRLKRSWSEVGRREMRMK
jgi:hypothetical protein